MKDLKTEHLVSAADGQVRTSSQIVVLHIPHSLRQVPAEERQGIRLDDAALNSELLRMTDAYTDELFPRTPVEAGSRPSRASIWFAVWHCQGRSAKKFSQNGAIDIIYILSPRVALLKMSNAFRTPFPSPNLEAP
jgi:hypothetical protein